MPFLAFQVDPFFIAQRAIPVIVAVVVAVVLDKVVARSLELLERGNGLNRRTSRQVLTLVRYLLLAVVALVVLGSLGIDLVVIAAGAGVLGIALGFAGKDVLSNFLAGIFLIFDRNFQLNDVVRIGDTYGIVRIITLRTTHIKTFDNNLVMVPNSSMINSTIINMTAGSKYMMTSVVIRVSYEENLSRVTEIMKAAIPKDDRIRIETEGDLWFDFQDIGDRFQGSKVIMNFTVEAHQEPWIRSKVREHAINALIKEQIKFQREAPR